MLYLKRNLFFIFILFASFCACQWKRFFLHLSCFLPTTVQNIFITIKSITHTICYIVCYTSMSITFILTMCQSNPTKYTAVKLGSALVLRIPEQRTSLQNTTQSIQIRVNSQKFISEWVMAGIQTSSSEHSANSWDTEVVNVFFVYNNQIAIRATYMYTCGNDVSSIACFWAGLYW